MLSSDLKRVALRLLKALDTDISREVMQMINDERWGDLVRNKFDPMLHHDKSVDQFRRDCLAMEFLRKAEFLDTGIDTAQVARDGFLLNEAQCSSANRHLEKFLDHPVLTTEIELAFYEILQRARSWIKNTLGPVPDHLNGGFGPGAVFESEVWRHKKSMTQYDKLRNSPCVSRNMDEALVDHFVWQTALSRPWGKARPSRSFARVPGNRFTTVPKDATKDRGIAIEPGVNVWSQLAVGRYFKLRLKRRKIDLKGDGERKHPVLSKLGLSLDRAWKGQQHHREMACRASITGSHATIDLSNASDTICLVLVKLLLPEDWLDLLLQLRSPMTRFSPTGKKRDARWYLLEKFSSMGNGFTFELETLIFCSLAHALGCEIGTDSWVYGDDIIVPEDRAADLLAVLKYVGMTPNEKKTFTGASNFRESCGGDFFFGHDVRPFYIKESPDAPNSWIAIANNLWSWSIKWSMPELMAVRASVLDNLPSDIRRCRGPEELGDLVIHDVDGKWNTTVSKCGSIRYIRVWRPVSTKRFIHAVRRRLEPHKNFVGPMAKGFIRELVEQDVALAAALIGLPSDGISPRNSVEGYRFGRVAYS